MTNTPLQKLTTAAPHLVMVAILAVLLWACWTRPRPAAPAASLATMPPQR